MKTDAHQPDPLGMADFLEEFASRIARFREFKNIKKLRLAAGLLRSMAKDSQGISGDGTGIALPPIDGSVCQSITANQATPATTRSCCFTVLPSEAGSSISSSRTTEARDPQAVHVANAPKRRYLKAHFSADEWAERCLKDRERARKRAAALTPEERAERNAYFAEAHRRHYAMRRDDPECSAKLKTTSCEKRERIRSDPARHAIYLERKRAAYRRRREFAKLFTAKKSFIPAMSDGLATMRAKALTIPAFDQIIKSMPAKWSMDFKEEIAAEAMILLLDRTAVSVAEAVKLGLKTHNRLYNRFKTISIDAENADGLRMIDTIASDHMADYL